MSYIGTGPLYGSYPSQLITPSGTDTSFTLNHAPANAASIIVSVDGVKQNAADGAYGVSGTTLDFGAGNAPASTTKIEIIYLGLQADSVVIDETLGTDAIIRTNGQTIAENITIPTTTNGVTAGPVTISASYVVTVNGNWNVV